MVPDTATDIPASASRAVSRGGRAARTVADDDGPDLVPVTVILPTYNEAENIETTIDRCRSALSGRRFEILVVDDDSPDRTWQLVRTTYRDVDDVRVIRRTEDRGLAAAVTRGFGEASHPYCVVMDADMQHPPEDVPALLDAFEDGVDVVIGSRYAEGGGIENWSAWRRTVSAGARVVAKLFLPSARAVSDPLAGFFAVRRRVVRDVDLAPIGYKMLLEILVKGDYEGVAEVPYVFSERRRGESKLTAAEYRNFLEHVTVLGIHDRFARPAGGRPAADPARADGSGAGARGRR